MLQPRGGPDKRGQEPARTVRQRQVRWTEGRKARGEVRQGEGEEGIKQRAREKRAPYTTPPKFISSPTCTTPATLPTPQTILLHNLCYYTMSTTSEHFIIQFIRG